MSCDPQEEFTRSSAISARVENRTGTPLWVECNWGCDDTGSVYDVNRVLYPGYNCRVWEEVKFTSLIVDAYDFFLPYLEKNFVDAKVSIYAYDELNKTKGELIKSWSADEVAEGTLFSLANTDVWTDYYDRPVDDVFIRSIKKVTVKKEEPKRKQVEPAAGNSIEPSIGIMNNE